MYAVDDLLTKGHVWRAEINGRWVIARPLGFSGIYGFWRRLKDAYAVLVGKADAFTWPEGQ